MTADPKQTTHTTRAKPTTRVAQAKAVTQAKLDTQARSAAHVVIINDSPDLLEAMSEMLQDEGYEVTTYMALAITQVDEIAALSPTVIILDWVFGGEPHGLQLLQTFQLHPQLQKTPVLLCTAATKAMAELGEHMTAKGVGILLKPFDLDDFLSVVQQLATCASPTDDTANIASAKQKKRAAQG